MPSRRTTAEAARPAGYQVWLWPTWDGAELNRLLLRDVRRWKYDLRTQRIEDYDEAWAIAARSVAGHWTYLCRDYVMRRRPVWPETVST